MSSVAILYVKSIDSQQSSAGWLHRAKQGDTRPFGEHRLYQHRSCLANICDVTHNDDPAGVGGVGGEIRIL